MKLKAAILCGAFVVLCLLSVRLSLPYASSGMSTQTAHVLTSMRALHDWGFWRLRGISTFLPRSRELEGLDFGSFTMDFNEAVYLSYPSGWLALPYAAFVAVHAVAPQVEVGPPFLMAYNILVDRLMTAVLLGFFLAAFLFVLTGDRLTKFQCGCLALLGCASWLLAPPVLYWTQNAYGMDEAIMPWVAAVLLFVARKRCRLSACSRLERTVLFFLTFIACSVDWYGWVAVGITVMACLCFELYSRRTSWGTIVASYAVPCAGVAAAGMMFFLQLLSFPDGFRQLAVKYGIRSAHSAETADLAGNMWLAWREYLPMPLRYRFVVPAACALGFLFRRCPEKATFITLFVALFVPPLLWTALLPEHSAAHEFSLLKFALPTAAMITLIGALLAVFVRGRFGIPDLLVDASILASVAYLGFIVMTRHTYAPLAYQDDAWAADIAVLMASVGPNDLPLADSLLLAGARPPHKVWYANRWIYPPEALRDRRRHGGLVNPDAIQAMHPVYLHPRGEPVPPDVERLCDSHWRDTGIVLGDASIEQCREDALRSLYVR